MELAPDERRGVTERNGEGRGRRPALPCSAIGQNALTVIGNIKARIAEISAEPAGRHQRSCRSMIARS